MKRIAALIICAVMATGLFGAANFRAAAYAEETPAAEERDSAGTHSHRVTPTPVTTPSPTPTAEPTPTAVPTPTAEPTSITEPTPTAVSVPTSTPQAMPGPTDPDATPPPYAPDPDIEVPGSVQAGTDVPVTWSAVVAGAVYTVTVTSPDGTEIVFSTSETGVIVPGAFFDDVGTYWIALTVSCPGMRDTTVEVPLTVTAAGSAIISVLHNKAEVIGKYRYCTAGFTRTFHVITASASDVILVYIDGKQVSVGYVRTEPYTPGTWDHQIDLVFSRGIHKIEFCTTFNPIRLAGRIASPSSVTERTMYATPLTLLYSWPEEGYHSNHYLTPGTAVTLKGELNGFDYIIWGSNYYFVRSGTLAYYWEDSVSYVTPFPAYPAPDDPGTVPYPAGHTHTYENGQCTQCGVKVIGLGYGGFMAFTPDSVKISAGETRKVSISRRLTASDVARLSIDYDRNIVSLSIDDDVMTLRGIADGYTDIVITLDGTLVGSLPLQVGQVTPAPDPVVEGMPAPIDAETVYLPTDGYFGANISLNNVDWADLDDLKAILAASGVEGAENMGLDEIRAVLAGAEDDNGVCSAMADLIMNAYIGQEDCFFDDFGYTMRDEDGSFRVNILMTDIIFTLGGVRSGDLMECLAQFSAAKGGIFEAETVELIFFPLTETYFSQYAGVGVQIAAHVKAGTQAVDIPLYDAGTASWSVRTVEAGKDLYAAVAGALSGDAVLVPQSPAVGAVPEYEEVLAVEGHMGIFADEFLTDGEFTAFGIRIRLK